MANLAKRQHMFNELFDLRSSFDQLTIDSEQSTSTEEPTAHLIFAGAADRGLGGQREKGIPPEYCRARN